MNVFNRILQQHDKTHYSRKKLFEEKLRSIANELGLDLELNAGRTSQKVDQELEIVGPSFRLRIKCDPNELKLACFDRFKALAYADLEKLPAHWLLRFIISDIVSESAYADLKIDIKQGDRPDSLFDQATFNVFANLNLKTVNLGVHVIDCDFDQSNLKPAREANPSILKSLFVPTRVHLKISYLSISELKNISIGDALFVDRPVGRSVRGVVKFGEEQKLIVSIDSEGGVTVDSVEDYDYNLAERPDDVDNDISDEKSTDPIEGNNLELLPIPAKIEQMKVPVSYELHLGEMSVSELIGVTEGDVLPIEIDKPNVVAIKSSGRLIGQGKLVWLGENLMAEVTQWAGKSAT